MIGDLRRKIAARQRQDDPDGGLGDLTPAEEHTLYSELLNEGDACECGVCGCNSPLIEPRRFQ